MTEEYSDNVQVCKRKYGADFLAVRFRDLDAESSWSVMLNRYTVPSRTDVYTFDWRPGRSGFGYRVGFFTDHGHSLPEALTLLRRDLDRKQVVEMLVGALVPLCMYRELVENLLPAVAPGSKALRACRAALRKSDRRVQQALKARREARAQKEG